MSEPPIGVTLVRTEDGQEKIIATAAFDGLQEALTAVEVLFKMWSLEEQDDIHLEMQRV